MPLTDLSLRPVYNHSNCPDMIAGLYEPLLQEAVRYDRTTYTFTAKGLIAAAAGTAGLVRNGGRIRLICDHTVRADILQALHDGQIQAETALLQTHDMEGLLLTEPDDLSRDHLELATWLVANGIMDVKVAIRDPSIFHAKSGIVQDAEGSRVAFSGSLNETLSGWTTNWESVRVFNDREGLPYLEPTEEEFQTLWTNRATGLNIIPLPKLYRDYIIEKAPASTPSCSGQTQAQAQDRTRRLLRLLEEHQECPERGPRQHGRHHPGKPLAPPGKVPPATCRPRNTGPSAHRGRGRVREDPGSRSYPENQAEPGTGEEGAHHRPQGCHQPVAG